MSYIDELGQQAKKASLNLAKLATAEKTKYLDRQQQICWHRLIIFWLKMREILQALKNMAFLRL